jgi:uncharacterized protein (TIGR02679 family)
VSGDPVDVLARPELHPLWTPIRKRLENNGRRITAVPLKLKGLDDAEIDAICALLGRRRPAGDSLNVDLRALDRTLLDSPVGLGLIDTLERLGPPVRDRKAERFSKAMERMELWAFADGHPATDDRRIRDWLADVKRTGRLTRVGGDRTEVLHGTLDALEWLLANGETLRRSPLPLSMIAAVQLGDAHALDSDTAVGALVGEALAHIFGADGSRAAWASVGVQLDQVASSALALDLPGVDGTICAAAQAAGQPLRVTWRMVEQGFGLDVDRIRHEESRVWICENPGVVSLAADQLGAACAPLVCTEGMPPSVTSALLSALVDAGADLAVHTDFDFGGMAIARHVMAGFRAVPWRLGASDYLEALDGAAFPLGRTIGATEWDPALCTAMNEHALAVHEEAVCFALLHDLSRG